MSIPTHGTSSYPSRRTFLKQSGGTLLTTALAGGLAARSYAAEDNTI